MPITYDAIGNPLSYNGWSYTWKAGRMLHSMTGNGVNAQFTYDHTGLRVKKTVNGMDTLYTLNGKKITHIRKGNTQMHFFYDAQGRPSMIRYNGNDYTHMHNLQGDIVSIVDAEGRSVVEYSYDAWGRPVYSNMGKTCTGSMADTLGVDNPFRYRGYVYDEETGLYYLRNRYYDPEWGRFLNADYLLGKIEDILSQNVFCYCFNAPIMMIDPDGLFSMWAPLLGIALGVAAIFRNVTSTQKNQPIPEQTPSATIVTTPSAIPSPTPAPTLLQPEPGPAPTDPDFFVSRGGKPKSTYPPTKDKRKKADEHQKTGERERNVGHDNAEEHSRKAKGQTNKSDFEEGLETAGGIVVATGITYLLYRGARMLPSLIPGLWWTIPYNLAMP